MKKITLFLSLLCASAIGSAQSGFQTIINDGFESTTATTSPYANGFPTNFSAVKQTIWTTLSATNNPNPATTGVWKQLYSNNATAANKDYSVVAVQEEGAGVSGNTQCLKFNITENSLNNGTSSYTVRIQSIDNVVSFGTGETTSKYEVKFWAKTDGSTRKMILNGTGDTLTITPTWTQYTLSRYVTGTSATSLAIDFCRQSDKVNYAMYMDGFTVALKPVMTVNAATGTNSTGFTANWNAISGATSYRLALQTSTDGNTWTNPISPITISDGNTNSYTFTGLNPNTLYQYRLTATDGLTTTAYPNWVQVTTSTVTNLAEVNSNSLYVQNGILIVNTNESQDVEIFDCLGKKLYSTRCVAGENKIALALKGIYLVKIADKTTKVIF